MKIRDILTKDPHVIKPDAMICEAARMMKECDIGMLPVCDGRRLVGSVTDRDLAIRGVAGGCDPLITKVSEVMTPNVFWCYDDQEIEEAAQVMETGPAESAARDRSEAKARDAPSFATRRRSGCFTHSSLAPGA